MELLFNIRKRTLRPHVEQLFGPWDEEERRRIFFKSTHPATHELIYVRQTPIGFVRVSESRQGIYRNRITI